MKRFVLQQLIEWKNREDRKPLILNGARQVGKTWLLHEFAKLEYKKEAYVVCRKNNLARQLFSQDFNVDRILRVLALNGEKDIQVDTDMNLTAIRQHISENGNKNVTIKAYPKLNHLFQTCEKGTLAEYGQLEETINPEVLKDMTEWIKKQQ